MRNSSLTIEHLLESPAGPAAAAIQTKFVTSGEPSTRLAIAVPIPYPERENGAEQYDALVFVVPVSRRAMKFTRITTKPDQMGGVPCIRGLRIPVATVVAMVADGMNSAEIVAAILICRTMTFGKLCGTRPTR